MSNWQFTAFWTWPLSLWRFYTYSGKTKSAPYRTAQIGPLYMQWIDESKRNEYDFDTNEYTLGGGSCAGDQEEAS